MLSTRHQTRRLDPHTQEILLLLGILGLGLFLRTWSLAEQSLSRDEVWEFVNLSRGIRAGDGFPPLYYILLRGWLQLFPGQMAARWLSVFFGVIAVGLGFLLGRRIAGRDVGIWLALLTAVSPLHIWYSQEGR